MIYPEGKMSRRKQARPNRLGEEDDAAMDLQMDKEIIAQEENHEEKSFHSSNGEFFIYIGVQNILRKYLYATTFQ